jgi:hypothetical protein
MPTLTPTNTVPYTGFSRSGLRAHSDSYGTASGTNTHSDSAGRALASAAHADSGGTATAEGASASGPASLAYLPGQRAHACGEFADPGDAQFTRTILRAQTTDDIPTELLIDVDTGLELPTGKSVACQITVLAVSAGHADAMSWSASVIASNPSGTAAVRDAGTPVVAATSGAFAWLVAVSTTGGRLTITVTGVAATTIRWVARVDAVEIAIA